MSNNYQHEILLIPESTPQSSYKAQMPDFVVPFDGSQLEVAEQDQTYVGKAFESFFDDALLHRVGNVVNASPDQTWNRNMLDLRIPDMEKGGMWQALLVQQPIENRSQLGLADHQLPPKILSLSYHDPSGNQRNTYEYGLGDDGVLRRRDLGDLAHPRTETWAHKVVTKGLSRQTERADTLGEVAAQFTDSEQSTDAEFDRLTGRNDQPVSISELDGLMDLIHSPMAFAPNAWLSPAERSNNPKE